MKTDDSGIIKSFNPTTGKLLAKVYKCSESDYDKVIKSSMEGISLKGRTVLMYSVNDQAGAWSRNKLGDWNYDVIAGGYRQRQLSIRLGINIILYALTLDYKKDMVHLPIILERLRRYQSQ